MLHAFVLAGALALTACVDGYPTEDAPLLDESAMSVAQLLATLNGVGGRPHLAAHYRYAMAGDCVLQVTAGRRGAEATAQLPLAGAEVQIRTADGEEDWQVLLRPAGAADAAPVPMLQGGKWAEAVQARSLVQQLQRRCAAAQALAGLRSPSGSGPH
ncbi:hypothetical protein [Pseudorhodoferax sp. Leaf267]|uniref:hypothetical protein n=1 Tax=Pseudorhodoferax sp. Leaf267 TaxID=1736316 RepID=UPI0006F7E643|nr:hypothetical protein [Pseudorhodoferax sp. Leaf267]KQP12248.1 hypothetical protein ASF43_22325 [Pseudorhodoferax sp. Leaf267]